jgi:microcystin-dependent protein
MSQPYVGEIRMFGGNFAPAGWAFCDGQLMAISDNPTLFNLIGTTYGGDGQSTFALPNLQSRVPMHAGNGFTLAQAGGVETVTLTVQQIPAHSHAPQCDNTNNNSTTPQNNVWAGTTLLKHFLPTSPPGVAMNSGVMGTTGGSQPHENMMPFLGINFIISLFGVFPSQT